MFLSYFQALVPEATLRVIKITPRYSSQAQRQRCRPRLLSWLELLLLWGHPRVFRNDWETLRDIRSTLLLLPEQLTGMRRDHGRALWDGCQWHQDEGGQFISQCLLVGGYSAAHLHMGKPVAEQTGQVEEATDPLPQSASRHTCAA